VRRYIDPDEATIYLAIFYGTIGSTVGALAGLAFDIALGKPARTSAVRFGEVGMFAALIPIVRYAHFMLNEVMSRSLKAQQLDANAFAGCRYTLWLMCLAAIAPIEYGLIQLVLHVHPLALMLWHLGFYAHANLHDLGLALDNNRRVPVHQTLAWYALITIGPIVGATVMRNLIDRFAHRPLREPPLTRRPQPTVDEQSPTSDVATSDATTTTVTKTAPTTPTPDATPTRPVPTSEELWEARRQQIARSRALRAARDKAFLRIPSDWIEKFGRGKPR
jgi:hypothetical protein